MMTQFTRQQLGEVVGEPLDLDSTEEAEVLVTRRKAVFSIAVKGKDGRDGKWKGYYMVLPVSVLKQLIYYLKDIQDENGS